MNSSKINSETKTCPYYHNLNRGGEKVTVIDHARFFASANDKISKESQAHAYHSMGIDKVAPHAKRRSSAAVKCCRDKKMDPTPTCLNTIHNPASTGIWDSSGKFDEERFKQLAAKAKVDRGKVIITMQMVDEFRRELYQTRTSVNDVASRVLFVVPVTWKAVTDGSFKDLFGHFFDHWHRNILGEYEPAFTVAHLRRFYTDSVSVFEMRMRGEIPPPKPVLHKPKSISGQLLLHTDEDFFESKFVTEACNGNTRSWIKLAVLKALAAKGRRLTALDVVNFPDKNPNKDYIEGFGIRFLLHDEKIPEDSHDFVGSATRTIIRQINPMDFTDEEGYFPNHLSAIHSMLEIFTLGSLPVPEVTWAQWESEQTLSNLVFCGLGQYYLTAARTNGRPLDAVYEVDLSALSRYAVRPGFEVYGNIAFFNADRKCCGILWTSMNRLIPPNNEEFSHVSAIFRSSLITICTISEHLVGTHWIISNGMVTAADSYLGPLHPIRRLVKPHTYNAVAVNSSSLPALAEFRGIAGRLFAVAESSWTTLFMDTIAAFKYKTLEEHFIASGLDAKMAEELPLYKDGLEIWNIFRDYVQRYVDIHYETDGALSRDVEMRDYWQCHSKHIPNRDYELGPLTKDNLVKHLTHAIYGVTAGHSFFGGMTEYLLDCKGLPAKIRINSNEADIQTAFQGLSLMSLTSPEMPKLLNDWSHIFNDPALPDAPKAEILTNMRTWQQRLRDLSKEIKGRNYFRAIPFYCMDPAQLQVSVSV